MAVYRSGPPLNVALDGVTVQHLRSGTGARVLLANGFLSAEVSGWDRWKRAVTERYPGHPVSRIRWEAQTLESLRPLVAAIDTKGKPADLIAEGRRQLTDALAKMKAGTRPDLPLAALLVEAPAKWMAAKKSATATGEALADAIMNADDGATFILMGFSLGARVMATAARRLAEQGIHDRLEAMHLVGAAITQSPDWLPITEAVSEGVWNYYSRNDSVLSTLYRTAEAGRVAAGLAGLKLDSPKAHDVDVSRQVFSHRGYLTAISLA